jgi:hypothetical protein
MRKLGGVLFSAALLVGASVTSASAASFTFNFNSLSSGAPSSGGVGPDASIQNYMNSILGCTCVTVTGAVADQTYNGEGYVVGPVTGNGRHATATSLTLGNSDGATSNSSTPNSTYDTFIANTSDSSDQISNGITMIFSGLTLTGTISFDYEIFPDASETSEDPADFTFNALNASNTVVSTFTQLAVVPSASDAGGDGTAVHSPNSGASSNETNAQWIGTYSTTVSGVTQLQFLDWPATIGVDDLSFSNSTNSNLSANPEPASLVLLGTGLLGLGARLRKSAKKTRIL